MSHFNPSYMPPDDLDLVVCPDSGMLYFSAYWATDKTETDYGTTAASQDFENPTQAGHALADGEVVWSL